MQNNIEPHAFFLHNNSQLNTNSMKNYATTVREYYQEYRHFDNDALKFLFFKSVLTDRNWGYFR